MTLAAAMPARRPGAPAGRGMRFAARAKSRSLVTGLAALILMALALPPLVARLTGGHPPSPVRNWQPLHRRLWCPRPAVPRPHGGRLPGLRRLRPEPILARSPWPTARGRLPVMRLDHVLVSPTATVRMTRVIRLPRTDHHGVLAAIEFTQEPDRHRSG
jgi:hypothetical protein